MGRKKVKVKHRPRKKHNFAKPSHNYRIIKTSIRSIVNGKGFIQKLRKIVLLSNKIMDDCLLFVSSYVLHRFNTNKPIWEITRQFLSYTIRVMGIPGIHKPVIGGVNRDFLDELQQFYNENYQPIYEHKRNELNCMSHVIDYMIVKTLAAINNNLKEHYINRLTKCIRIFGGRVFDEKNTDPSLKKKEALYKLVNDIIDKKFDQIHPLFTEWFNNVCKPAYLPDNIDIIESLRFDPHKNPQNYLHASLFINREFEFNNIRIEKEIDHLGEDKYYEQYLKLEKEHKELKNKKGKKRELRAKWKEMEVIKEQSETIKLNKQKIKMFSVLPLPSFGVKYVTFDTVALRELFTNIAKGLVDDIREDVWDQLFDMDKKIFRDTKAYDFHHMIGTDGTGCNLYFKNKNQVKKKDLEEHELLYVTDLLKSQIRSYDNFVPNDPGVKEPINMMDSQGNKFRYTRAQRIFETKSKLHSHIMEKEKKKIPEIKLAEEELSKCHSKTTIFSDFKKYLKVRAKHYDLLSEFYQRPIWQKQRWYRFINTQKSEAKVRKNIRKKFGKNTLVVLGDGGAAARNLHCGPPTICLRARKIVGAGFHSVLIDEFRTSKLCHKCTGVLDNVSVNGKEVYRLLKCTNPDCNEFTRAQRKAKDKLAKTIKKYKKDGPIIFNRDENAIKNMLNIVDYMLREDMVNGEYQVPRNFRHSVPTDDIRAN